MDPSATGSWVSGWLPWAGWMVASFLFAGAISSYSTVLRMSGDGLLSEEGELPFRRLLDEPRSTLLTLALCYFASVSLAAASFHVGVRSLVDAPPVWIWILAWILQLLLVTLGAVGVKSLALTRPLGYFRGFGGITLVARLLLRPLSLLFERLLERAVPAIWTLDLSPPLSGLEIRGLLDDDEASSHMESDEVDWARSIFELGDSEVREIMVPRIDMVGIEVDTPFEEALPVAAQSRFTRLPVFEGSQDRILGILHTKDLLSASVRGETPTIRQILRPAHFLPESKRIDDALAEFREGRIHLGIVVDEYGGTAGIVTLEDILEEIVGEIRDEFDQEGELLRPIDDHRTVVDPRIDLDDLNQALQLELPAEESDTLAGLLYQLSGRVPSRGDQVELGELRFTIDRVEGQRIRQVTLFSPTPLQWSARASTEGPSEGGS